MTPNIFFSPQIEIKFAFCVEINMKQPVGNDRDSIFYVSQHEYAHDQCCQHSLIWFSSTYSEHYIYYIILYYYIYVADNIFQYTLSFMNCPATSSFVQSYIIKAEH